METWKDIPGWEGCYQVSTTGKVKSLTRNITGRTNRTVRTKEIILKPRTCKRGYRHVVLYALNKGYFYTVHKLVMLAFVGPRPGKFPHDFECNHKDGIKTNNNISNLEWITCSENRKHAYRLGLSLPPNKGKFGAASSFHKEVKQYDLNNNLIAVFGGVREAQKKTGVHNTAISMVCCGRRKTAGGYFWRF